MQPPSILPPTNTSAIPDAETEGALREIDLDRARLVNDNERALIDLRKSYGNNMINFLWTYFAVAMILITVDTVTPWDLPEGVAVALVGGTAVSVLGVVGTIVAGLFQVKKD